MQLLVYARNHRSGRTFVGLALGEDPRVEVPGADDDADDPAMSYVEVRMDAGTLDVPTAVSLLVTKAIARDARRALRREVTFQCDAGAVTMRLAPGFLSARDVCEPLEPVLARCRVWRDTLVTGTPGRAGAPEPTPSSPVPVADEFPARAADFVSAS